MIDMNFHNNKRKGKIAEALWIKDLTKADVEKAREIFST